MRFMLNPSPDARRIWCRQLGGTCTPERPRSQTDVLWSAVNFFVCQSTSACQSPDDCQAAKSA